MARLPTKYPKESHPTRSLDLPKMLAQINDIVESDWAAEMEMQTLPGSRPFTQEEAITMANALGKVYSISHCTHCAACQGKYFYPQLKESA